MKMWMRALISALVLLIGASPKCGAQGADADTLDVVNWNLEYFGAGSPLNATTQTSKTKQLMNAINADIYAICEVVNIDSFAHVVASLNGSYGYVVSPYGSFAADPGSSGYSSTQKLGLIYRKSMVRNITTRAMLSNSSTAYYNFSSGRYPLEVKAEVLGKDGAWRTISFMVYHAKAYTDNQSCTRRIDACHELKDTLDHYYPNNSFLLLGDFNDALNKTICSGGGSSNYLYMVQDSVHYKSITLPLAKSGAVSIDGYNSLIDNVIASDEMYQYYVQGSAQSLRSMVKGIDPNYDNDVSDHFPVKTRYVLQGPFSAGVSNGALQPGFHVYPNPAMNSINVLFAAAGKRRYSLINNAGQVLLSGVCGEERNSISLSSVAAGVYYLIVRDNIGIVNKSIVSIVR